MQTGKLKIMIDRLSILLNLISKDTDKKTQLLQKLNSKDTFEFILKDVMASQPANIIDFPKKTDMTINSAMIKDRLSEDKKPEIKEETTHSKNIDSAHIAPIFSLILNNRIEPSIKLEKTYFTNESFMIDDIKNKISDYIKVISPSEISLTDIKSNLDVSISIDNNMFNIEIRPISNKLDTDLIEKINTTQIELKSFLEAKGLSIKSLNVDVQTSNQRQFLPETAIISSQMARKSRKDKEKDV